MNRDSIVSRSHKGGSGMSSPRASPRMVREDPPANMVIPEQHMTKRAKSSTKASSRGRYDDETKFRIMLTLAVILFSLYFVVWSILDASDDTAAISIPECKASPWKPDEALVGSCQNSLKPHKLEGLDADVDAGDATRIARCATDCCASESCVAWQYRRDIGCRHGGDIRLGMEKDGPGSWCHDHPPKKWQGQYVGSPEGHRIGGACDAKTYNPDEQPGQCFGLGDERKKDGKRFPDALSCMQACCADKKCGAWQYHADLGCFYFKSMHGCTDVLSDPVVLEPFTGRRKKLATRQYVDKHDRPWSQTLS